MYPNSLGGKFYAPGTIRIKMRSFLTMYSVALHGGDGWTPEKALKYNAYLMSIGGYFKQVCSIIGPKQVQSAFVNMGDKAILAQPKYTLEDVLTKFARFEKRVISMRQVYYVLLVVGLVGAVWALCVLCFSFRHFGGEKQFALEYDVFPWNLVWAFLALGFICLRIQTFTRKRTTFTPQSNMTKTTPLIRRNSGHLPTGPARRHYGS
jgi:hypothetical protein